MNKFTELRRQLILRLIVFEYDLFGQLEMVEAMLLGKLTTAQTSAWLESLEFGSLTAVAKVSVQFSKYSQMWMGLYEGVDVRATSTKLDSKPLDQVIDIGGLSWIKPPGCANSSAESSVFSIGGAGVYGNAKYDRVKALTISIKETGLRLQGSALVQPYGDSLYGELKVYPKTWQGIISYEDSPEHLYGIFESGKELAFCTQSTIKENPTHCFGSVGTGDLLFSSLLRIDEVARLKGELVFSSLGFGVGTTVLQVKHLAAFTENYNMFSKILITKIENTKHPRGEAVIIQDASRGYIDVTITRIIAGKIGFDFSTRGKSTVVLEQNLRPLLVSFLDDLKIKATAEVKNSKNILSVLEISSEGTVSVPGLIPSIPIPAFSKLGGLKYKSIPRTRYGAALLVPGPIVPLMDGVGINATTSYQKRDSIYGLALVKARTAMDPVIDSVTVLTYQIINDDEEGEIYEIQTDYHKEGDGAVLMGWRYFNELIE